MPDGKTEEKEFINLSASSFSAASAGNSWGPSGNMESSDSIMRRLSVMTRPSAVRTHGVWPDGFTCVYQRGLVPCARRCCCCVRRIGE